MPIKSFLLQVIGFVLLLVLFMAVGVILPATPRAKTSLLFAKIDKDSLLKNTQSPRIVFVGGSNISMSIDSQTIKDSLHFNPVNTGLHAAIGLVYMLEDTANRIKKNDIVVVIPEYNQLYGDFAYGSDELLRMVLDVKTTDPASLKWKQIRNIFEFLPAYAFTKFKPSEYFKSSRRTEIYLRSSFNQYGDCVSRIKGIPPNDVVFGAIGGEINQEIIDELRLFKQKVSAKGARMFVSFPAFEKRSYDNSALKIREIEKAYRENGFAVLGNPEQYRFPNSLMYDTPYHLSYQGVAIRTQLLINDLREAITKSHD